MRISLRALAYTDRLQRQAGASKDRPIGDLQTRETGCAHRVGAPVTLYYTCLIRKSTRLGVDVTLEEKVTRALLELEPRLEQLAEGYAELMEVDAERNRVTLKLIGGRLN